MDCIKWGEEYNLGIAEIDQQHQGLIGSMNKLCDSLEKGEAQMVIHKTLEELEDYVVTHFGLEEKYFQEFQYEEAEAHIAQHKLFSAKVAELKEKLNSDQDVSSETIVYLGKWFAEHVLDMDKKYIECFHEHGLR